MRQMSRFGLLAMAMFAAPVALGHPGHETVGGVLGGWAHPFTGLDHLLALLAVGILAGQRGGRALWRLPGAVAACMALGGLLAGAGLALPMVEPTLMASVLVLGVCVALSAETGKAMLALPAVFAVFHGYAHVAEMPAGSAIGYGVGFVAAAMTIQLAGVALGVMARRTTAPAGRLAGAAIAVCGVMMMARLI